MRSTVATTDSDNSAPGTSRAEVSDPPAAAGAEPPAEGSALPAEGSMPLAAGMTFGRYELRAPIGEGGMGIVWSAYDPALGRMVAVKVLRSMAASPAAELRLRREAQAMAKLVHPNVIRVYDVGVAHVGLFIAMEYIVGCTLRDWLARAERTFDEIIDVFAAAGRGLAAAHSAGLVHRDFKPGNVLVSDDGRVLVTDFGLARLVSEITEADPTPRVHDESPDAITRAGTVVGTPAYMAPEQYESGGVDARADQFSFCVTLWEALYGAPPFPRGSAEEVRAAIVAGAITPPPANPRVPAYTRAALERGLAANQSARFPTMPDLLDALDVDRRRRRRRRIVLAAAGGSVVVAAVIAVSAMTVLEQPDVCASRTDRFAGVWDPDVKDRLAHGVAALGKPFAQRTFAAIADRLDHNRSAWEAMRRDSCEATRVRREQSDTAMDLRTACLDRKFEELKSFVGLLATPDAAVLDVASDRVASVGDVAVCADVIALSRRALMPGQPERRQQIMALDGEITQQRTLVESERRIERTTADSLVARAKQLGYAPTTASALYVAAFERKLAAEYEASRKLFDEALLFAESGGDDLIRHQIETQLADVTGAWLEDFPEGIRHVELALAVLDRLGDQPLRRSEVLDQLARIYWRKGDFPRSRQLAEEALALAERVAPNSLDTASRLLRLGTVLNDMDEPQASMKVVDRGIAIVTKLYGPDHPKIARLLNTRSGNLRRMGKLAEAKADLERALAIFRSSIGEDSVEVGFVYTNLGTMQDKAGDYESAIANHRKTVEIYERKFGPNHSRTLIAYERLGGSLSHAGRNDEARALLEHVLEMERQRLGENHTFTANAHFYLANHLRKVGKPKEALPHLEAALRILRASQGADSKLLSRVYDSTGETYAVLKQYKEAARSFELALSLMGEDASGGANHALIENDLAVALLNSGDRARAKVVAASARARFVALGDEAKEDLADLDAWIAKHHL